MNEEMAHDPKAYAQSKAIEQVFENNFDCYTEVKKNCDAAGMAMSKEKFTKVVNEILYNQSIAPVKNSDKRYTQKDLQKAQKIGYEMGVADKPLLDKFSDHISQEGKMIEYVRGAECPHDSGSTIGFKYCIEYCCYKGGCSYTEGMAYKSNGGKSES